MNVLPVIIAGGSGSRLWPMSSSALPKQFISTDGVETLFQKACLRCSKASTINAVPRSPLIVTNEEYRFLALKQLGEAKLKGKIILEPSGRNTAPAMTLAALYALELDDPILFVSPADHIIQDGGAFQKAAIKAVRHADSGAFVVLGITPKSAHTGYGYIRTNLLNASVEEFVEKPDFETAIQYLNEGNFSWNAGIFVVKASVWLKSIGLFREDIAKASKAAWSKHTVDGSFIRPDVTLFSQIPAESIDYAVIEKLPSSSISVKMVPLDAGWSDLGSWDMVWDAEPKDANGNVVHGNVICASSSGNYLNSTSRLLAVVGIDDAVVVETADVILVAKKTSSQEVRNLTKKIKVESGEEFALQQKIHRPWGWFMTTDRGKGFQVKRIQVDPGASLSLQKHAHRSEHWTVIRGTADVTVGNKKLTMRKSQSIDITLGAVHRLSNPGKTILEIIEVQFGSYLGEDDIIRFEDKYGRCV